MRNIYLIEPTEVERKEIDYDEYDGFVIIADTAKEARKMCLTGDEGKYRWLRPKRSSVRKIGETKLKPQVVLASFNAG